MPSVFDGLTRYASCLNRSFAAAYLLLDQPRAARRAVVALLAIHSGLLAYSAYVHSPTLNEPGHLAAGLAHWKFGRFDIYSVNPPLVRMVAALPVMAVGYHENWSGFYSGPGARPEFKMGEDFVAANGERSFFLFMIARWACIPFSWIGGVVCYLWARDLYGRPAGVVACAIWCFEPNILAHASLITADMPAAALGLAACYTFWKWLKRPTWTQAALTGIVLGVAELAKTTLILFYPLWPIMWLVYRWPERRLMLASDWMREAAMLALRMAIGLYVMNLGYGFEGSFKPLGQYTFVSDLFTGAHAAGDHKIPLRLREGSGEGSEPSARTNRFANSWLSRLPVPFPTHYLAGIDLQQKDFEHYGRPSYLRGVWQDHGWWYYYLYAVAIKVPLGLWALAALTLLLSLSAKRRAQSLSLLERLGEGVPPNPKVSGHKPHASFRDYFILLFAPAIIFAIASSKSGFNEHMRYVLPCFPFAFVWIAGIFGYAAARPLDMAGQEPVGYSCRIPQTLRPRVAPPASVLLLWSFASSLWIYPHSLSYFSEAIGGPYAGPEYLLSSNVDWGQDLLYVRRWLISRSTIQEFLYLGGYQPSIVRIAGARPIELGDFDPECDKRQGMAVGVSVSILRGARSSAFYYDTYGRWVGQDFVQRISLSKPLARIGYTTVVFGVP